MMFSPGWGPFASSLLLPSRMMSDPTVHHLRKVTCILISHKVFIKSSCKNQFPHKSFNLSVILVIVKDTLMDLCGNRNLQNDFMNTFCEIRSTCEHLSNVSRSIPRTDSENERLLHHAADFKVIFWKIKRWMIYRFYGKQYSRHMGGFPLIR